MCHLVILYMLYLYYVFTPIRRARARPLSCYSDTHVFLEGACVREGPRYQSWYSLMHWWGPLSILGTRWRALASLLEICIDVTRRGIDGGLRLTVFAFGLFQTGGKIKEEVRLRRKSFAS